MRYLYLLLSLGVFLLVIITYFQNLAGSFPTIMYFLTLDGVVSPAWAILVSFFGGLLCATLFFLFVSGGKIDLQTAMQGGKKEGEDTGEWQ